MKQTPLKTMEEAIALARGWAEHACEQAFIETGERPHVEQRGNTLVIVWPDGEETNQIEVEYLQ